jgi:hypothetical protein
VQFLTLAIETIPEYGFSYESRPLAHTKV